MKLLILALGRRGASVELGYRLLAAARQCGIDAGAAISAQSEQASRFRALAPDTLALDTASGWGPAGLAANFPGQSARLLRHLAASPPDAVFTVMPHLWTPLLAPRIRRLGIRYATLIHDVRGHPGDPSAIVTGWLRSEARGADLVVTMSKSVGSDLRRLRRPPRGRVATLFHPDYVADSPSAQRRRGDGPLRILSFGRILGYKGLPLLIDAAEGLKRQGTAVTLGIAGEGDLRPLEGRLRALGAEVENRWFADGEIGPLLARYDAVVLAHTEASQSGIPALAFAHGLPVIATPVGGIVEQIEDGRTGVMASEANAPALAAAIGRLAGDGALYDRIAANIVASAASRSPARFIERLAEELRALG